MCLCRAVKRISVRWHHQSTINLLHTEVVVLLFEMFSQPFHQPGSSTECDLINVIQSGSTTGRHLAPDMQEEFSITDYKRGLPPEIELSQ